jgi:photosystem II stability/assembly factor-like uncharacterized protein
VRSILSRFSFVIAALLSTASGVSAQSADPAAALHWRQIGPGRAGRARALAGVPSQPNVFYIGFDNGGVWRSTDYGSNWVPIFDKQSTGSIGAIAVAPSNPNVLYVGTGAGIIRPDLAIGDGLYKSIDAGKTWAHIGLNDSQMIANIEVDPANPDRFFVAVLGHPYGPNAERGIFRSTDGGKTLQKVLYQDEYTSANDVRIDPSNPNVVYAALWEQQQAYIEGQGFGGAGKGIFKSTDGGTTWKHLTDGLPSVIEANLAIAPSNPNTIYAMVAGVPANAPSGGNVGGGTIAFYRSTDAGEHWKLAVSDATTAHPADNRPLGRIGGGDLATITVDPKNEKVVYSASTVFWRTEDAGLTWSAVRGAPGGDDYQKSWVNPTNPDILLVVADQGGVVSGNRGKSWSNWYNQPTAAMYHVSVDMGFPYRVCGGQQDSGSACVDSRSMDGEITFHDWHPVNIQEYGIAASDPKDPDMVYGSQRSNVSLFNRKTGQTSLLGPDASQRLPDFNRNVRTMPIEWSPIDHSTMYYTSNVVWKSANKGSSWTRISPDLTRQAWVVPASVGKYASGVAPSPQGAITALSVSGKAAGVMWAGTDDGQIQMTADGGTKWNNVTPAAVKPWARVFNIEAGHFDTKTAYAAVNTLRLDDINPHFFRTRDGGKTWTEINTGIAAGAVSNSIREDPRKKGLLYAATDLQVWYSIDDGDHWMSLKNDMPAISVRDIVLKDDSVCMCSDLVAGTHGRGFWILDNITPLRQAAAVASGGTFLFKPATALRVRFATNDPTPWPPEVPAGENPAPGGLIDYYLGANANGEIKLEILDATGKVVRSYMSEDRGATPEPATDPEKYNLLCQTNPNAADCALPLYWPAPLNTLSSKQGMHRYSWDLHLDPVGAAGSRGEGSGDNGAVPGRTYAAVNSPWAPPGSYTVRLTADGKSYTQPITLKLDPRVKTTTAGLTQLAKLSLEMYNGAKASRASYNEARALVAALEKSPSAEVDALKADVEKLAPAPTRGGGGRGGFGGGAGGGGRGATVAPAARSLETVSNALNAAAMSMQSADVTPTAKQVEACAKAKVDLAAINLKWTALKTTGLASLNAKRKAAGQEPIVVPKE